MTQRQIIRKNLKKSDWEITKDKCDSTRAHRQHQAANGKHKNKRKIYCTNVHLRIIEILMTLMYNLSAVTAAITVNHVGVALPSREALVHQPVALPPPHRPAYTQAFSRPSALHQSPQYCPSVNRGCTRVIPTLLVLLRHPWTSRLSLFLFDHLHRGRHRNLFFTLLWLQDLRWAGHRNMLLSVLWL